VYLCRCSSAIDQSSGSGVLRAAARGIDSEGDEDEDDEEVLDDSDNSDPELPSPRVIRQTNLSVLHFFTTVLQSVCLSVCLKILATLCSSCH